MNMSPAHKAGVSTHKETKAVIQGLRIQEEESFCAGLTIRVLNAEGRVLCRQLLEIRHAPAFDPPRKWTVRFPNRLLACVATACLECQIQARYPRSGKSRFNLDLTPTPQQRKALWAHTLGNLLFTITADETGLMVKPG